MDEQHNAELVKAALRMALDQRQQLAWCITRIAEVTMRESAINRRSRSMQFREV